MPVLPASKELVGQAHLFSVTFYIPTVRGAESCGKRDLLLYFRYYMPGGKRICFSEMTAVFLNIP